WGRRKIELALRQKQVDADIIGEALDAIDEEEYAGVLRALLASKMKNMAEPESYEERNRLFRFAVSRGFEISLVGKTIASLLKEK
ncbi:MAG: RecX family transcriptional regulator, partial [Muribaculaceae bacterium]|nr:RecX family transcriptional regulator [Muribaculaceae bacterium]